MRSIALALCIALPTLAQANGRAPGTSTITFKPGDETKILAGLTFGTLSSDDGGATWQWMCEAAVGYGGNYDPDYVVTSTGSLFATTFDGLKVNRDRCVYEPSVLSSAEPIKFFSTVAVAPDGTLLAAAVDPRDGRIYRSTDDGVTFPTSVTPGQPNDWWQSLEFAPSSSDVVYLAGYRLVPNQPSIRMVLRSDDGGQSFTPLPVEDFTFVLNSNVEIAGISKTDPDLVYARITASSDNNSNALYRSSDGGQNWTKILELPGATAFVVRNNGHLVAATLAHGSFVSTDQGANWTPLPGAPQINCLAENAAGEVWACTQNYGMPPQTTGDGFGIMKSTDLQTWTGVLRYQDIQAPFACPAGTVQNAECDAQLWCGLCAQLGCDPQRECPGIGGDVTEPPPKSGGGCCQGSGAASGLMLAAFVGAFLVRRRKTR